MNYDIVSEEVYLLEDFIFNDEIIRRVYVSIGVFMGLKHVLYVQIYIFTHCVHS